MSNLQTFNKFKMPESNKLKMPSIQSFQLILRLNIKKTCNDLENAKPYYLCYSMPLHKEIKDNLDNKKKPLLWHRQINGEYYSHIQRVWRRTALLYWVLAKALQNNVTVASA